jgi:predicted Zn-dependent protease
MRSLLSFSLFLAPLLFCVACLGPPSPRPPSLEEQTAFHSWLSAHPEIQDPKINAYLKALSSQLRSSFAKERSLLLVRAPDRLAFSAPSGEIVISTALVQALPREAELAFIIAHEIGHQELGHLRSDRTATQELDADRFGIALISLAGYDPRYALLALGHLAQEQPYKNTSAYPTVAERYHALKQFITKSRWHPPAISDKRAFQALRRALATMN